MSASTLPAVREQISQQSGPTRVPASPYHLSIGYLRAFITVLVVAHHAALAFIRFAAQPSSLRDRALRLGLPLKPANSPSASEHSGSTAGKACQMRESAVREGLFGFCSRSTPSRALSFLLLPRWAESAGRLFPGANRQPIRFFAVLTVLSGAAYVPLAVRFNRFRWSPWGPFTFQTSRALHYLVYFVLGIAIAAYGLERGFLARDGKLRRRWWLLCVASLVIFAAGTGVGIAAMTVHPGSRAWEIAGDSTFVLSSAASSFAFLALFVRFAGRRKRIFDSLNENAYGIYLVHYAFVSWAQLALLNLGLPAILKAPMVFVSAGLLSWGTVALIRLIPLGRLASRGA